MEIGQEQISEWREVMRRMCVGSVEVQQAIAAHNRTRIDLLLQHLGGLSARAVAQLDRAGAQPRFPVDLPADGLYDTPANRRYLKALKQAMCAAQEVDAERSSTQSLAADLVQMLMENVIREIYGPPVEAESLFGKADNLP